MTQAGLARCGGCNSTECLPSPAHFRPTPSPRTLGFAGRAPDLDGPGPSRPHTGQKRLPFKQFQVLLTPSSGSFSSFPHGTCSLSVSRPYLALDGTYHPLRAAIPNNSTLKSRSRAPAGGGVRGCHSPWRPFPGALALRRPAASALADYNSPWGEISMMSSSLFTRSYWGNPS